MWDLDVKVPPNPAAVQGKATVAGLFFEAEQIWLAEEAGHKVLDDLLAHSRVYHSRDCGRRIVYAGGGQGGR